MYEELRSWARKSWVRLISQAHSTVCPFHLGKPDAYILCIKLILLFLTMNKQTSRTCDQTNADTNVKLVARIKW